MGSAASALSPEQSGHVAHVLKARYEEYQKQNLSDDEIRTKLAAEFGNLTTVAAEPGTSSKISTGKVEAQAKPLAKFNGKSAAKAGKGRRRSFDNSAMGGKPLLSKDVIASSAALALDKIASTSALESTVSTTASGPAAASTNATSTTAVPVLVSSESTPNAVKATEVVDSWDSVTQQPFCTVCQMAFKSDAFLERHIKFSDLHIKNLLKKDSDEHQQHQQEQLQLRQQQSQQHLHLQQGQGGAQGGAASTTSATPLASTGSAKLTGSMSSRVLPLPETLTRRQEEGVDYRLLYQGCKLFWRTQENIDFHLYLHVLAQAIEIIPFDAVKNRELPRIYLDYATLQKNLTSTSVEYAEGDEEVRRTTLTTHILQHLQLHNITGESAVTYVMLSGDEHRPSPVLNAGAPSVLVPVTVTRRRRTNAEEIEATMRGLTKDRQALVEATDKAGKVASIVHTCVALFNETSKQKWFAHLNPVRQRWIKAIRLVVRQILVSKTKKMLYERAKALHNKQRQDVIGKAKEMH